MSDANECEKSGPGFLTDQEDEESSQKSFLLDSDDSETKKRKLESNGEIQTDSM